MALNLPRHPDGVPADQYDQWKLIYDAIHALASGSTESTVIVGGGSSGGGNSGGSTQVPTTPIPPQYQPLKYIADTFIPPQSIVAPASNGSTNIAPCQANGLPAFGFTPTGGISGVAIEIYPIGLFQITTYTMQIGIQFRGANGSATRIKSDQPIGYAISPQILLFLPHLPILQVLGGVDFA